MEHAMRQNYPPPTRHVPQQEAPWVNTDSGRPEAFPPQELGGRGNHMRPQHGTFLEIDIPSVEMERYSVMFGSVLGDKQPSGLLARRDKTLERPNVTGEEVGVHDYSCINVTNFYSPSCLKRVDLSGAQHLRCHQSHQASHYFRALPQSEHH
jgi:hypothetical protein